MEDTIDDNEVAGENVQAAIGFDAFKDNLFWHIRLHLTATFNELYSVEGVSGKNLLYIHPDNLTLHAGLSDYACEAIIQLLNEKKIYFWPEGLSPYLAEGQLSYRPITNVEKQNSIPHWAPLFIRPGQSANMKRRQQ